MQGWQERQRRETRICAGLYAPAGAAAAQGAPPEQPRARLVQRGAQAAVQPPPACLQHPPAVCVRPRAHCALQRGPSTLLLPPRAVMRVAPAVLLLLPRLLLLRTGARGAWCRCHPCRLLHPALRVAPPPPRPAALHPLTQELARHTRHYFPAFGSTQQPGQPHSPAQRPHLPVPRPQCPQDTQD